MSVIIRHSIMPSGCDKTPKAKFWNITCVDFTRKQIPNIHFFYLWCFQFSLLRSIPFINLQKLSSMPCLNIHGYFDGKVLKVLKATSLLNCCCLLHKSMHIYAYSFTSHLFVKHSIGNIHFWRWRSVLVSFWVKNSDFDSFMSRWKDDG